MNGRRGPPPRRAHAVLVRHHGRAEGGAERGGGARLGSAHGPHDPARQAVLAGRSRRRSSTRARRASGSRCGSRRSRPAYLADFRITPDVDQSQVTVRGVLCRRGAGPAPARDRALRGRGEGAGRGHGRRWPRGPWPCCGCPASGTGARSGQPLRPDAGAPVRRHRSWTGSELLRAAQGRRPRRPRLPQQLSVLLATGARPGLLAGEHCSRRPPTRRCSTTSR